MISKDEKFVQILSDAMEVFMKYGIKSVTMDDLARQLRISKKTLYKYFKDKNDLVLKGIELHHENEVCSIDECCQKNLNAIDESFEISRVIVDQLRNIHPSVMYDLEKYHPEALGVIDEYKKTVVKDWVSDNMRRGIEEGLYREDLNIPILTALYLQRMNDFFHIEAFPKESTLSEIYLETFRYHIRGLASEKGIEYLKQKVKNTQTK